MPDNLLILTRHEPVNEMQQTELFRSMKSYVGGVQREDWVPFPGLLCVSCEWTPDRDESVPPKKKKGAH
jgi:hypothetical protein